MSISKMLAAMAREEIDNVAANEDSEFREFASERSRILRKAEEKAREYESHVSRDFGKLRAAQRAVDSLPSGLVQDALTYAVQQWMAAAFQDHSPLTGKDLEHAQDVAKRYNETGHGDFHEDDGSLCELNRCDRKHITR